MQKRSHKLLAASFLASRDGFRARRYELAFLFGSFQPDCNPLSYLKGSLHNRTFGGHNYTNSNRFMFRRINRLQRRNSWNIWHYYTLGKLTHYVADAFTFPHNAHYTDTMLAHHQYETDLREYMAEYLPSCTLCERGGRVDTAEAIAALHDAYMNDPSDIHRDAVYIVEATELLMSGCVPPAVPAYIPQPSAV